MPLTADHTPSLPALSARDKALNDVFTTALEGGIGYWSVCSRYHWGVTVDGDLVPALDFIAVIEESDDEDDEPTTYVIDRSVISLGIRAAHARGNWNDYQGRALRALNFGKWDDADYDATTADLVVQFGLFGEYRYS